jgi:XTP/dITP diphosphohydrolase
VKLVLATRNPHKRRELARLLAAASRTGAAYELEPLADDVELPPETGATFARNALAKARAVAAATGRAAIADDSGIEAAALDGAPGVRSARYAGPGATDADNLIKLRRDVPAGSALTYVCALAHVDGRDGAERVFEGRCAGRMAARARGERGFGYDPVFVPDDHPGRLTMAQLADAEKDAISHRGRAARALLAWLEG